MKLRWPFERAIAVTLFLRSGNRVTFTAQHFSTTAGNSADGSSKLIGYSWEWGKDAPQFLDASQVEAAQTRKIWRLRGIRQEG